MKFTIEVDDLNSAAAILSALTGAVPPAPLAAVASPDAAPEKPKRGRRKKSEAAPAAPAAPATPTGPSVDDVKDAIREFITANGVDGVKAAFEELKADKLSDLAPEQYPAFLESLKLKG